jgi:uncharacterized protein (DUF885 family)
MPQLEPFTLQEAYSMSRRFRHRKARSRFHATVRRTILRSVLVLLATAASPRPVTATGEPGTHKYTQTVRFRGRSIRAMEALWKQDPVHATALGMHRYDGSLASWSPSARAARVAEIDRYRSMLRAIDVPALSPGDQVDHALIMSNLERARLELTQINRWRRDPALYADECVNGLYYLLVRKGLSPGERLARTEQRLRQIPRVLAEMQHNVQLPARPLAETAADELDAGATFIEHACSPASALLPAGRSPGFTSALGVAVAAMRNAAHDIRRDLDGPGRVSMGRELYEKLLRTEYFCNVGSDSLLRLAQRVLNDTRDLAQAAHAEAATHGRTRDRTVEDLRSSISAERRFLTERNLLTLPPGIGELVPVETPAFLTGVLPEMAMEVPAPFEQPFPGDHQMPQDRRRVLTQGTLYVPSRTVLNATPDADHFYPGARGCVFTCDYGTCYSAHHLQASIANRLVDPVRKAQQCSAFIGGWALYADDMLQREGFARPANQQDAAVLRASACLAIADVRLQRGDVTFAQAVSYVVQTAGVDASTAVRAVKQCCHRPGEAAAALLGREEILRLRRDYLQMHGEQFALKHFHDELLAEGAIPLALSRRLVCPFVHTRVQTGAAQARTSARAN